MTCHPPAARALAHRPRHAVLACVLAGLAALGALAAPSPAGAALVQGTTIDGPGADVIGVGNTALSRDGTGAVVYVRRAGGIPHVFASLLTGGGWSTPQQLDVGLPGVGSQPVVAASTGGRVVAVFNANGTLYDAVRPPGAPVFAPPQAVAQGGYNPALSMSNSGVAYATFTGPGPGVPNVYAARSERDSTGFAVIGTALNLDPSKSAGETPEKRSKIDVAADGTALAAWGETSADGHSHVIARKVFGMNISAAPQDLTVPGIENRSGGSADSPDVTLRDVSDFGWVSFRQTFVDGLLAVSRTVARRLVGSQFDPPATIDSLSFPTNDGSDVPHMAIDSAGDGLAVTELTGSHQVIADVLLDPVLKGTLRLDGITNAVPPLPTVSVASASSDGIVAWQQSLGGGDPAAVHARAFVSGTFTADGLLSRPEWGAADATQGLSSASDRTGDSLVAFVQGDPSNRRLVVAGQVKPPADFALLTTSKFTNKARPEIGWEASSDPFGLAGYTVFIDGRPVGTTTATRFIPPVPVADGTHRLTVAAVDRYGQSTQSATHQLRIWTRKPKVSLSVQGSHSHGSATRFVAKLSRSSRFAPKLAKIRVSFGDGRSGTGKRSVSHSYANGGGFTVALTATDQAGNKTVVHRRIQIS